MKRLLGLLAAVLLAAGLFCITYAQTQYSTQQSVPPPVRTDAGQVTLNLAVPITEQQLKDLGIDRTFSAAEVRRMVSALAAIGAVQKAKKGGGGGGTPGYTCKSETNQCTCNAGDPLDCVDILSECKGPLHPPGKPDDICPIGTGETKTCVCTWH